MSQLVRQTKAWHKKWNNLGGTFEKTEIASTAVSGAKHRCQETLEFLADTEWELSVVQQNTYDDEVTHKAARTTDSGHVTSKMQRGNVKEAMELTDAVVQ